MEPKYKAVQSTMYDFNLFICILLCILGIIPGLIYILVKNVSAHHNITEFYDEKIVRKSGVVSTKTDDVIFKGVISVSIDKSFRGKIYKYGTVKVDIAGSHLLSLEGVKYPEELKKYLDSRKIDPLTVNHVITD